MCTHFGSTCTVKSLQSGAKNPHDGCNIKFHLFQHRFIEPKGGRRSSKIHTAWMSHEIQADILMIQVSMIRGFRKRVRAGHLGATWRQRHTAPAVDCSSESENSRLSRRSMGIRRAASVSSKRLPGRKRVDSSIPGLLLPLIYRHVKGLLSGAASKLGGALGKEIPAIQLDSNAWADPAVRPLIAWSLL